MIAKRTVDGIGSHLSAYCRPRLNYEYSGSTIVDIVEVEEEGMMGSHFQFSQVLPELILPKNELPEE
jgi:hypothetical protein